VFEHGGRISPLSKSILDSGWSIFQAVSTYKLEAPGVRWCWSIPRIHPERVQDVGAVF